MNRDDRTQPCCWLTMLMMLDAVWTQVSKKFADCLWNIVHNLSQTIVQCLPLLMIRTMSNQQIRKTSLQVGDAPQILRVNSHKSCLVVVVSFWLYKKDIKIRATLTDCVCLVPVMDLGIIPPER